MEIYFLCYLDSNKVVATNFCTALVVSKKICCRWIPERLFSKSCDHLSSNVIQLNSWNHRIIAILNSHATRFAIFGERGNKGLEQGTVHGLFWVHSPCFEATVEINTQTTIDCGNKQFTTRAQHQFNLLWGYNRWAERQYSHIDPVSDSISLRSGDNIYNRLQNSSRDPKMFITRYTVGKPQIWSWNYSVIENRKYIMTRSSGHLCNKMLIHCGRATHICVSKLTIIGPNNGLSPGRRQAIIWTNAGILSSRSWGTHLSEIHIFSLKQIKRMWKCRLQNAAIFVAYAAARW